MKIVSILILSFLSIFIFDIPIFGASPSCPPPPPMIDLNAESGSLSTLAQERARTCYAARLTRSETAITDFVCPSGDYDQNDRPYTREILAYQIAVATVFQAIDKNSLQYAKSLQCLRQKDPIIWQQSNKVFTDTQYGYASKYEAACNMSYILGLLKVSTSDSSTSDILVYSSDTFPQYCETLAFAKVQALRNLGDLLAARGIGKSYQNDKDIYLSQIKGKYTKLLENSSRYFRLMGQAVAKMDVYLKQTIR